MKTFDKSNLKQVRDDMSAALEAVAKKHGIQLSLGGITFSPESFSVKLTAVIPGDSAEAGASSGQVTKWAASFKSQARLFGLKPEHLGKSVKIGSQEYVIAGMRPRAKQPVVLRKPNGSYIAYSASAVASLIG